MKRVLLVALVVGALGALGGFEAGKRTHPPVVLAAAAVNAPAVRWKSGALDLDQLRARISEASRHAGVAAMSAEQKKSAVDEVVRDELLADEAIRRGLIADAKTKTALRQVLARRLIESEFDDNAARHAFDEKDLRAYYDAHISEYVRPEKVDLSVRLLPQGLSKKQAEKVRAGLPGSNGFEALGPLSKAEMEARMGADFTKAAWLLVKLNEAPELIETPKGYYLAQLHGRLGAVDVDFERAREQVRSRLWFERRSAAIEGFLAELKKAAELQVDPAEIGKL